MTAHIAKLTNTVVATENEEPVMNGKVWVSI
jgi:hypothetical protein